MTAADRTPAEEFGQFITQIARNAGYDITSRGAKAQLANDAGVSQATVSRMLAGRTIPEAKALEPLARALGVPPMEMLAQAGVVSSDTAAAAPRTEPPLTNQRALAHLGLTDPADQALVLALIERIKGVRAQDF